MDYQDFLRKKEFKSVDVGFERDLSKYPLLDYQFPIVKWALKRGKSAIFADTGLGKTIMQLVWAESVHLQTGKPVLILAPLAVSQQSINEGIKFGIDLTKADPFNIINGIQITNYEQLSKYNPNDFSGIVLDESSILKGLQGKVRKEITEFSRNIDYRLSCTATPSPNDFMELGTQCEFLGIMSQVEMLSMFFINDMSDIGKWRLKGHGKLKFFEWLSTWSVFIKSPSDLGFDGSSHKLPNIKYFDHVIKTETTDQLFSTPAIGLNETNKARKNTIVERVNKAAEIANSIEGPVIVWCNLNDESSLLKQKIKDSVEVKGSDKNEHKEKTLIGFSNNEIKCLITKPKIAGFGMNWQNCQNVIFVGLSHSWESYYQAIRRCWRFGQKKEVNVHIISADVEGSVIKSIKTKNEQNESLGSEMIKFTRNIIDKEISSASIEKTEYQPSKLMELPKWLM